MQAALEGGGDSASASSQLRVSTLSTQLRAVVRQSEWRGKEYRLSLYTQCWDPGSYQVALRDDKLELHEVAGIITS